MDDHLRRRIEASGYARPGFAEHYNRHRPRPPVALLDLLPPLAGVERPRLVVDLGSGTGLSTRVWSHRADEVVGVEPNEAMRSFAEQASRGLANVWYVGSTSYETELSPASADLVTASQSLQWMRPDLVFPEVDRILRPGGVFCAYEYFTLQTPLWEPEAAFDRVRQRTRELRQERGLDVGVENWPVAASAWSAAASSDRRVSSSRTTSSAVTAPAWSSSHSARAVCVPCSTPG